MTRILLYSLGLEPGTNPPVPSTYLRHAHEAVAEPLSRVFGPIAPWQPFAAEDTTPGDRLLIVLLTCSWEHFTRHDYFVAGSALALHEAHRAHLIPIMIDPLTTFTGEQTPWLDRYRHIWTRLDTLANRQASEIPPAQLSGVLQLDTIQRVMAAALQPAPEPIPIQKTATTLFFSYSHHDEPLRDQLAHHLKLLERTGLIQSWHDRKIPAGDDWSIAIDTHLYTADVILMLLSADFFASDFCSEIETPIALERHRAHSARVIPVLLRPVLWSQSPLAALQALPTGALPVASWPSPDSAFVNICEGILGTQLAAKPAPPAPDAPKPSSTRKRVIDTAMPARVEVNRSFMLVVLIRKQSSGGLRLLLAEDPTYGIDAGDVHSRPVALNFPLGDGARPENIRLTVEIGHMEIEPHHQKRTFTLTPDGDSQPIIFMLSVRREGLLRASLDLHQDSEFIVSCPLQTFAVASLTEAAAPPVWIGTAAFNLTDEPRPAPDNTAVRRINYPGQTDYTTPPNPAPFTPNEIAVPKPSLQSASPSPPAPMPAASHAPVEDTASPLTPPRHAGSRHIDLEEEEPPRIPESAACSLPAPPPYRPPSASRSSAKPFLIAASLLVVGGLGIASWLNIQRGKTDESTSASSTAPPVGKSPENPGRNPASTGPEGPPSLTAPEPCTIPATHTGERTPASRGEGQRCIEAALAALATSPESKLAIVGLAPASGESTIADAIHRAQSAQLYFVKRKGIPENRLLLFTASAAQAAVRLQILSSGTTPPEDFIPIAGLSD